MARARKHKEPEPQESREDLQRQLAEEYLKYSEFLKKNKIYAFRAPTAAEAEMERVMGERYFFPPNPKQQLLLDAFKDHGKKVFTFTGGNRSGKTTLGVILPISVCMGFWPWSHEKIKFTHGRPRRCRLVGQAWETHIKTVLIPALKEWWPDNRPLETKKNNQGVEAVWKDLATGSTIEILSNAQESDVAEGWSGDYIGYDEPPKREMRVACSRGLIDRQGWEFFGATLLKEAWIHREVMKARTADGKPDTSVFNVTAEIYDNVGYGLTLDGVDQFAKALKPEEKEARLYGKPSYLSTLVCPRFSRDIHVIKPFKIPLDWLVDICIDFHPSRRWAITFMATARNNFKYICKELWEFGNPKYIGEEIVREVMQNHYRTNICAIDPLAKGDGNNDQTVFAILEETLGHYGIPLDVASKDKDNGIALLNNLLWTENSMPGLFYFDTCVNSIRQTEDWLYDPETLKPSKEDDDFVETIYRHALLDTQWYPEYHTDMKSQKSVLL